VRRGIARACCRLLPVFAVAGANASGPSGIEAIAAYAGTWESTIVHVDTPYGKTGTESHTLRNDCWRSGEYFACHQYVDGKSMAVVVFAFDDKTRTFATYPLTPGADTVHAGKLVIDGNVWTFPWETTETGKTTWFRVINVFTGPDRIEYRQEYSTDRKHWTIAATGHERRISTAPVGGDAH
jgi:hypothetical protein